MFGKTLIAIAIVVGIGYYSYRQNTMQAFDYEQASREERLDYLEAQANALKGRFNPTMVAQFNSAIVQGRSLIVSYNLGDSPVVCSGGVTCLEKHCKQYVRTSLYRNKIPVRVEYTNASHRKIGQDSLNVRACKRFAPVETS